MRFVPRLTLSFLAAVALLTGGCKANSSATPTAAAPAPTAPMAAPTTPTPPAPVATPVTKTVSSASAKPSGSSPIVKMVTTQGTILIKLFPQDAPLSCANFEKLIKKGFYDGLMFHRVTDLEGQGQGHIVQGGDPTSRNAQPNDPSLGQGGPGYSIKGEFTSNGVNNPLTHVAGAVAMARSNDPDSAGSQFYICTTPVHSLDGNYAVFGQVIQGLDVAVKIQVGDRMTKVTMEK
jgi:peptidyl-prolyl cis-trans isomerase B (cyclophilin B)